VRNNTFFLNSFINNTSQAVMDTRSINSWDKDNKGNYWSNYNGTDVDGDGIGDSPYIIDMNNQDNYPLMSAYEKPKSTPSSTPPEFFQTAPLTLTVILVVTIIFVGVSVMVYLKKKRIEPTLASIPYYYEW
jgi:hypothetical protein